MKFFQFLFRWAMPARHRLQDIDRATVRFVRPGNYEVSLVTPGKRTVRFIRPGEYTVKELR